MGRRHVDVQFGPGRAFGPPPAPPENGAWKMSRRWNGDQRDFGMSFRASSALVRVKMHVVR